MKTKPKYKMCRRIGSPIFEKCQTQKFIQSEARKAKASSGKKPKVLSDYGSQLLEKQKVRFSYGISEKQLSNYVKTSTASKGKSVTDKLYELLESRLDNVVYRLGFAGTRRFARQLVSHGHFVVNGKKVTIPSYQVKIGEKISVRDGSRSSPIFNDFVKKSQGNVVPSWLSLSAEKLSSEVKQKPKYDDPFLKLDTVLEFYSR